MATAGRVLVKQRRISRAGSVYLGAIAAMSFFTGIDLAAAAPKSVVSRTSVLFSGNFTDYKTGGEVAMFGTFQLKTKFQPATGNLVVQSSLRKASTIAFATSTPPPSDPLRDALESLKQIASELKAQIVEIKPVIFNLESQLHLVRLTDSDPLIPGKQIDRALEAAIKTQIVTASASLLELTKQLEEVAKQIKDLINQIDQRESANPSRPIYKAAGTTNTPQAICPLLGCERLLKFSLRQEGGERTDYLLRVRLSFSERGDLILADPDSTPLPPDY
jgi:hypothetical protein